MTNGRLRGSAALLLAAALLGGCARHPAYQISDLNKRQFGKILRVPPAVAGRDPLIFGLTDCTLYKATIEHQDIVDWGIVLRADWGGAFSRYMTTCKAEDVRYDGTYVRVTLCAEALGRRGGCANGGDYRSRDGENNWEIATGRTWIPLRWDKDQE